MVESFAGSDITMADEIGEDGNHLNKGADLTIEDKANNIINGGTDTTWMFSFLGKKLWKRKKYKGKISPSSSRMMRTISIHHLECADFVSQSEVRESASDGEISKNALSFDSSAMRERESDAIKATHESAKSKHGGEFQGIYAAVYLPGSRDQLKGLQVPTKPRMLTKSVSFPGSEFSRSYRKMNRVSAVTQGTKSESVSSFINNVGFGSESDVSPVSHELRKRREAETVLNRSRNLKERIKDVILENRKEKKRICRDRVLHKVPFGHKLLEDLRGNFNNAPPGSCSKFAHTSFQRSCSLNESLDRYSHLLEPVSLNEKEEVAESSKSMRKDDGLFHGKLPNGLGRILSSPVFRSYSFSEAVQSEQYDEASQQIVKPESLGILMEENGDEPNKDAIISPILEKNDCEHEMVVDPDPLLLAEEGIRSDKFVAPTVESFTEIVSQVSVEEEADLVNRHEDETDEADINTAKPSFISSLDLNMVEGFSNSAKYLLREEHSMAGYVDDEERMATSLLIHVGRKYDILFEFVRRIFSKSGYGANLSPREFATNKNKSFEQSVLYDLINEALADIYEQSTAPNPWLLHFHSKIRSMAAGIYLLRDVWAKIRRHLCAPQGTDATLEDLMAHDFGKDDGWMNLRREAECVASQLEYLIMDDLLDEAVVDSDEFDF